MRNTLRQKSKVGVKHSVYQGGQNQCPSHCAKNGISLWAAAAGLTGLTESVDGVKLETFGWQDSLDILS